MPVSLLWKNKFSGTSSQLGPLIFVKCSNRRRRGDGPVQLGDDLADGLGGAGGGGDDVLAGTTAVSPQLA